MERSARRPSPGTRPKYINIKFTRNSPLTSLLTLFVLQTAEADAGDSRDLRQQADLHSQDPEPGRRDPAQPHPERGLLHHRQGGRVQMFVRH